MGQERNNAITSYVTDMLSLETHIAKALQGQISDLKDDSLVWIAELREIHFTCERHVQRLEALSEVRSTGGTSVAEAVKRATSSVLGIGAAAVDFIRSEKAPKDLRDNYAALSLAYVGYIMLLTTATALDDREVEEVASTHLQDYAKCISSLQRIIPEAVLQFLINEGHSVRSHVLPHISDYLSQVWKNQEEAVYVAEPSSLL